MNREMFVRVAATALRQMGDPAADQKAEAIATQMDFLAAVMGEAPMSAGPRPAAAAPPPPPPAFPAPPPEAVAPVAVPAPQPSMIITDTRMPAPAERVVEPSSRLIAPDTPPVRSLRQPAAKMKVEDLNMLIQQRTPPQLTLDVPMEDGSTRFVVFQRDVLSQHALDSVQLIYYPMNTRGSAREATEVQASIHVDDLPLDLSPIVQRLAALAVDTVRPKGAPRELPIRGFTGAVQSSSDYADGGGTAAASSAAIGQAGTVMNSSAGLCPEGYAPPEVKSVYHPGQLIPPEAVRR